MGFTRTKQMCKPQLDSHHLDCSGYVARRDLTLDAALVVAALDPEHALVTPILVPAVHDLPIRGAVLGTPADDLDSVAAQVAATRVLIDTRLVCRKVVVDGEDGRDGSILQDVALDALLAADAVGRGALH